MKVMKCDTERWNAQKNNNAKCLYIFTVSFLYTNSHVLL